jgi:hypothetical protein
MGDAMRLFVDTEFTDFAPERQQLISLGVVSECGYHKFYVEISDYRKDFASDFVKGVVWPLLEHGYNEMQHAQAAEEYSKWLDRLPIGPLQFVIDYSADFVLMAPLMKFTKRSYGLQMFNIELVNALKNMGITDEHKIDDAMRAVIYSEDNYFKIDPRQHHSLVDACESRHAFLRGIRAAE